jgi:hypothetical protein
VEKVRNDEPIGDAECCHLKLEILRYEDFAQNDTPLFEIHTIRRFSAGGST